ncbi:tRNA-specific adenosine deaminase [Clostridia bacterium]|nr:tRNA-specific adenosine deaminase [Clostridia bacterium]
MEHRRLIAEALTLAERAAALGESPVGCIILRGEKIIARTFNRRELDKSATAHAEILAIEQACAALNSWRLTGCTLYVTLEPCPMCAGAIAAARIPLVVFGAYDPKGGAYGGLFDMNTLGLNHRPEVIGGVLEGECSRVLTAFFAEKRIKT